MPMEIQKLNESYSFISGDHRKLEEIHNFLRVLRPNHHFDPLVKSGFKSPYVYFSKLKNNKLLVLNGHLGLLDRFGISTFSENPEFSETEIDSFLNYAKTVIPFEPHDYQINAFIESLKYKRIINLLPTSSGKSLIITLLCEFFRLKNKKGLLLVPNINLLTQLRNDFKEYNFFDLFESTKTIGGGQTDRTFDAPLIISTWQSLVGITDFSQIDYLICDEAHRYASEVTSEIIKSMVKTRYRFAFTGTLPEDQPSKMMLIGLFNKPKRYITANELIERGLATPVKINSILLNYHPNDVSEFLLCNTYSQQIKFIREHEKRNKFIVDLVCSLKRKNKGNTLVLFQFTEHGKTLFIDIMKELYGDIEIQQKDITGKKSFDFQKQYGVFFLNGEDNAQTRESTRKILEEYDNAILVSNFQILSTGVNIKKLHNMVLASPLKSYVTITQSLGRGMRKHESKSQFTVFDIVDVFKQSGKAGIFYRQYKQRLSNSYNPEGFPVKEVPYVL